MAQHRLSPWLLALAVGLSACGQQITGTTTSGKDALYFADGATGLPPVYLGEAYNAPLTVAGGAGPYTFQQVAGTLPPGLRLNGQTLTGTPTKTGSYKFTLEVTDSTLSTKANEYNLTVQDLPPTSLAPTLPTGEIRGETRIPVTIGAPRATRAARLVWELPENVKVTRVQPSETGGMLFWKQDGRVLTLDVGFKVVPRNGARIALISVKPGKPTTIPAGRLGYEARDGSGKLLNELKLVEPPKATAPQTDSAPASTTKTDVPPSPGTDTKATTDPATDTKKDTPVNPDPGTTKP